ncbi:MAG: nitrous oxide-stimulated promoter family protein [Fibrobacteres bacterium]|nr:nitrous oxide-stimulated promoter family protein [Fibrobacterota bacterium]
MRLQTGLKERQKRELVTITIMVTMYCKAKHRKGALCSNCRELLDFSIERIHACKIKSSGVVCSSCKVHCFPDSLREHIKAVMRFSGPRMIIGHPVLAVRHFLGF